jgi:hypothetical protein
MGTLSAIVRKSNSKMLEVCNIHYLFVDKKLGRGCAGLIILRAIIKDSVFDKFKVTNH